MFLGTYTQLFQSAISPWTTLGPLAFVVTISMVVEGSSDYKRHLNDAEVNNTSVVVLTRTDLLDENPERDPHVCGGRDVMVNINKAYYAEATTRDYHASSVQGNRARALSSDPDDPSHSLVNVAFEKVKRKDIRQGQFVLVKNREMVPADLLLLASSNDRGGAYIETSSIDGETNLKLRNSPHLPKAVLKALREATLGTIEEDDPESEEPSSDSKLKPDVETVSAAVKRLTRFSALGRPDACSSLDHPSRQDPSAGGGGGEEPSPVADRSSRATSKLFARSFRNKSTKEEDEGKYIAALTTEAPNASVHTFTGTLTLPPYGDGKRCQDIPLGADNVLLRGAVIRNTEWIIGLAFFTGSETKLVQNSFETPSKFSQLDRLMNKTVAFILLLMVLIISYLAASAVMENGRRFEELYYIGYNKNETEPWPFFAGMPIAGQLGPPEYVTKTDNWLQFFFLYITLVSNMIPLSLYVTIEGVQFFMLWLIYKDKEMYDETTDTQALARSTNVSDLGRIQYIFSDKTGTLTQNVMRFKRCSVDGMAFGGPIARMKPKRDDDSEDQPARFHPIRQLLVGRFNNPTSSPGLEGFGETTNVGNILERDDKLTFHAEMFLRVMSLCHTVVVEKDIDNKEQINSGTSVSSGGSSVQGSGVTSLMSRMKRDVLQGLKPVSEGAVMEDIEKVETGATSNRERTDSVSSIAPLKDGKLAKASDGAPHGYAYQSESPDEGALVCAASTIFGYQVVARDTNGICLRCPGVSHLQDETVTNRLKDATLSLDRLAAESVGDMHSLDHDDVDHRTPAQISTQESRDELWTILAVNKFDSDRKRMSVLLRSPPELGDLPILFCKGADSSMLADDVCSGGSIFSDKSILDTTIDLSAVSEVGDDVDENGYKVSSLLGMQMHLGEFAKEGLRTLVLGMKILTEDECSDWLAEYESAATSLKDRDGLLFSAAKSIERDLHIVGATAIEDKLQVKVPETIATLEKAGIKLWVLTGDKRETAVEIGYSTNVLTSKMHLTQVPDNGRDYVRTQMSMEFIRLVKNGRLPLYQKDAFEHASGGTMRQKSKRLHAEMSFKFGKLHRHFMRFVMKLTVFALKMVRLPHLAEEQAEKIKESERLEKIAFREIERRKRVRSRADVTIKNWITSSHKAEQKNISPNEDAFDDDLSLASDDVPAVFKNADSARNLLNEMRESGEFRAAEKRALSVALLTAEQTEESMRDNGPVDEDLISLQSFMPHELNAFDKTKRTLLERLFAVDRDVRKGRLHKHVKEERLAEISSQDGDEEPKERPINISGPRALVIEGSALKYLLGNPEFEEMLFSVASSCNAVIACRVSPKQKAELVALVRSNIDPEPITLAIGDGANDVGMIQEAHVGVGISGKEGKQAVNASDFAIAQFRFLEPLVLVHGRWNFFRLSTVVLFSFYKNACMAGVIILFGGRTVYSGTAVFDDWIVAMLNFVAAWPIIFLGMFDRCLSKDYVRRNPEVYRATRENELITLRTLVRWVILCLLHVFTVYYCTLPQQAYGGGVNPGFLGLMKNGNPDAPGDGEGGDLKSVGTVAYTCMIIIFGYKVRFAQILLIVRC